MGMLSIAAVIGAGLALYFRGRSSDSNAKKVSGAVFAILGLFLLVFMIIAEAKKADLI